MKRKTPKEILTESFHELAQTKETDKITVKEITSNCGYSPATFYRYFKDKYDLIATDYANVLDEIFSDVRNKGQSWKSALLACAEYYEKQKSYLVTLLRHAGGFDAFMSRMITTDYAHLHKYVLEKAGKEKLDLTEELCLRFYVSGVIVLSCEWIMGEFEATPEEVAEAGLAALPENLHAYLLEE